MLLSGSKKPDLRILFVSRIENVHTSRWIAQLADQGWDLHLFPSTLGVPRTDFKNVTIYNISSARPPGLDSSARLRGIWPLRFGSSLISLSQFRFLPSWANRSNLLAWMVRRLKPDVVHSLEIQNSGYSTLEAKAKFGEGFPPWIVTNWGSDIYLFGRLAEHADKIRAVLSGCDYYNSECQRDVGLAHDFGFKGTVLPVLPGGGGFDLERTGQWKQPGPSSARRLILLKGYQHWAGRALVGLRALELCADALKGYRMAVYSASPDVRIAAELTAQSTGLPIEIVPQGSHEEMLRLHGQARVSIGLSISDAISTSLLEAMIMGSFPIQSHTSCADEWVRDGEAGLLVPPENPEAVAAAIRRAVSDDALVDRGTEINTQTAHERLDLSVIKPQVVALYEQVVAEARLKRKANYA